MKFFFKPQKKKKKIQTYMAFEKVVVVYLSSISLASPRPE